jgi:uncharacterized protein (TIGR02145 family)
MINSNIGKYKITRLIGKGGMASVYEAIHEILGTKVAIKILNPLLSANIQIKERFINEAKLMASLNHPNIAKVIDFDEQSSQLAIVMEFLEGEDLNELIKKKGALPEKDILNYFNQSLSALQYAHEKGIVHRDIKPSNIFVLPNGQIKILDFGIAKLFGQGNEMTQTGTQIGTPIYMSPEQVKSDKSIDHRSDIYSLGVTLYFAVYGKPPYDVSSISQFEIFNKIVFEPIKFAGDSNFNDIIRQACDKNRELRFQFCEEWIDLMNNIDKSTNSIAERTFHEPITKEIDNLENKNNLNKFYIILASFVILSFILIFYFTQKGKVTPVRVNPSAKVEDAEINGKSFNSVQIGNQTWMAENLNISYFRNGDPIPEAKSNEEWIQAVKRGEPTWCYYENDPSNGEKYGKLYNWYAVNDERGLAPEGWHISNDEEWQELVGFLGGQNNADVSLKTKTGWGEFDSSTVEGGNGTDIYGFSGLPCGYRKFNGVFFGVDDFGYWWSLTDGNVHDDWFRLPIYSKGSVTKSSFKTGSGFSVRCLRD